VRRVAAPCAIFEALLDDLPRAAGLVETIGAGRYRIHARPDGTVHVDDHFGARADVACLLAVPGARVYRAAGGIEVSPLPALRGTGIIALRFEADEAGGVRTGGQIAFRLESRLLHRIARPIVRLLESAIDRKIRTLVSAAIAVCEHEAARVASSERA
jgi:hypothetical protein